MSLPAVFGYITSPRFCQVSPNVSPETHNGSVVQFPMTEWKIDEIKQNSDKAWSVSEKFLDQAPEQELVSRDVLLQVIRFAIEERHEYDTELISFVRSLFVKPQKPPLPHSLEEKPANNDYSQIGQSVYMDQLLKSVKNGFFVEAGAYNGEILSNSLFFELERNWTGLLVEAIPSLFEKLRKKNRKVFAINACLSGKKPLIAKIRVGDLISGRTETMHDIHKARVDTEKGKNGTFVYMPCFSINTLLRALDVSKVDYFSLDVEGAEVDVLRGLDHKTIDYRSFSIEHNGYADIRPQIKSLMEASGYKETKSDIQDAYYLKK